MIIWDAIKWFFEPIKWLPWHYGVEGTHGEAKYFGLEGIILFPAVLFWILPIFIAVLWIGLGIGSLFFGFEPKGPPIEPSGYVTIMTILIAFPSLLMQTVRLLMLRKVNEEQLASMEKWHEILPHLPKPDAEMTKKDLAVYVDAIYKKERERQLESQKKSFLDN